MSTLLSLGARAMFANYAALQTTGNNIANANTAGYSRQQVELATANGQYTGAGFFGKGVNVETVTRAADAFLTRAAATSRSQAALDATQLEQLERLEALFAPGEQGIGYAAGQLLNAFVDVANRPQDAAARQVVLARTEELASRFRGAGEQLDTLQSGVVADLRNSVATVNSLAQRVADINRQIADAQGSGHTPNDLLDQRDSLVSEISQYIQVSTIQADDGTLGLFVGGGQRLVLGGDALKLQVQPDLFDPAKARLGVVEAGVARTLQTASLGGGSLAGLLSFQDGALTDARAMLGQMASALAGRLNEQQALGLDQRQPPGAGAPLLNVGAPRVLPASSNTGGSTVSVAIADVRQLQPSDYELRPDPANPGEYTLTRLSDGVARNVLPGDTVDGFTIVIGAPAPAVGDRFLLQPVSRASAGVSRALDDPKGIAAASQVLATTGADNSGTASVATLRTVSTALDPNLTADIAFTDDSGSYSWTLTDASNTVVSSGTGSWSAGTPIALNGFELQLNGVPRSGDTLQVARTLYPVTNNGNALSLLDLRDEGMVGRQLLPDGSLSPGDTITGAYARVMADIGVRVQSARASESISRAVAANAEAVRSAKSGVNLDEEAARLIQYQQGYQAAAKVLQIAQSIFDTLIETAGR